MSRHDAVWHYGSVLCWAKGEGITKKRERIIERGEDDDDDGEEPKRKWQRRDNDIVVRECRSYKVAKVPGYCDVTVNDLINKFRAMDEWFTWYLEEFLLVHSLPILPSHNVPFGVFKRLSVTLPQILQVTDETSLKDMIRTTFPELEAPQDQKKAVLAQFNTVLAFKKPGLTAFLDPLIPLKGMYL